MSEIEVRDKDPWWFPPRETSSHLEVWCGDAYLLVNKETGHTQVGYQDEETYLPTAHSDKEVADWVKIFQWRAEQTFPWKQ